MCLPDIFTHLHAATRVWIWELTAGLDTGLSTGLTAPVSRSSTRFWLLTVSALPRAPEAQFGEQGGPWPFQRPSRFEERLWHLASETENELWPFLFNSSFLTLFTDACVDLVFFIPWKIFQLSQRRVVGKWESRSLSLTYSLLLMINQLIVVMFVFWKWKLSEGYLLWNFTNVFHWTYPIRRPHSYLQVDISANIAGLACLRS